MADFRNTIDSLFDAAQSRKSEYFGVPVAERAGFAAGKPFANHDHKDAEQVITRLVRETTRELIILSRELSVYGHSGGRLRAQFYRYPKLRARILVEARPSGPIFANGQVDWSNLKQSALTDLIFSREDDEPCTIAADGVERDGHIAIRVLPVQSPVHFVVSDAFAYRLEDNDDLGEAVGHPDDPARASVLVSKFESLWALSVPLRIPEVLRSAA